MKMQKLISIDTDIYIEIANRTKMYNFNFSSWVEDMYTKQFLDADRLKQEKQDYEAKIKQIDIDIKTIEEREKAYSSNLSRHETRFLCDVPRLIKEGKDKTGLLARFNKSFRRDWTTEKFVKTYIILGRLNGKSKR